MTFNRIVVIVTVMLTVATSARTDECQDKYSDAMMTVTQARRLPAGSPAAVAAYNEAISAFRDSIALCGQTDPTKGASAQNCVAQAYFDLKDYAQAKKEFATVISNYNQSDFADDARFMLGFIEYQGKQYDTAITHFKKVDTEYSARDGAIQKDRVPYALFMRGKYHATIGDKSTARKVLSELIRRYPKHGKAGEARKMLEEI